MEASGSAEKELDRPVRGQTVDGQGRDLVRLGTGPAGAGTGTLARFLVAKKGG